MFLRKYWILLSVLLLAVVGVCLYMLTTQTPQEPIVIYKPVEIEKPIEPKPPPPGADPNGHWHGDEWHDAPHEPQETPAAPTVQYTAPRGAVTKPDFPAVAEGDDPVAAAYQRLAYIKNNPYAWGGVHSERATQLIAELLPTSLPMDHAESEARELLIDELCEQNDPRAAEALIAIMCDGGTKGRVMFDTLEAIGPPAVPYILPYLQREDTKGSDWIYVSFAVFDPLNRIGVRHRADLGGILDHIIIPKLEEIAADENNERYHYVTVRDAKESLSLLRR